MVLSFFALCGLMETTTFIWILSDICCKTLLFFHVFVFLVLKSCLDAGKVVGESICHLVGKRGLYSGILSMQRKTKTPIGSDQIKYFFSLLQRIICTYRVFFSSFCGNLIGSSKGNLRKI